MMKFARLAMLTPWPVVWADAHPSGAAAEAPGQPGSARIELRVDSVVDGLGEAWPMYCGVPWPRGRLSDPRAVRVVDAAGEVVPSQIRTMSHWAGTQHIRWLGVDFVGGPKAKYYVELAPDALRASRAAVPDAVVQVSRTDDRYYVDTGPARFIVPSRGPLIAGAFLDLNGDGKFGPQ
jgi:hypothetical protein